MPKWGIKIVKQIRHSVVLAAYMSSVFLSVGPLQTASAQPGQPQAQPAQSNGIAASAMQQIADLMREKDTRSPSQQKIDSHLLYAVQQKIGTLAPSLRSIKSNVQTNAAGLLEVKLTANVTSGLLKRLAALGVTVSQSYPQYHAVYVWARLDQLETIAAESEVTFIMEKPRAATNKALAPRIITTAQADKQVRVRQQLQHFLDQGSLSALSAPLAPQIENTSQGDVTHRANMVRSLFGVRGAGVKIGVLSDGVDTLASRQASGDLSTVTILPGQAGSGDEGTAMLELVHDLAPDADLYFASGFESIERFAQNILALRAAGCDIIIDDIGYFVESPFQKGQSLTVTASTNGGIVTEAVNNVAASGALYFSSSSNDGNFTSGTSGTWEGNFASAGAVAAPIPGSGTVHDFDSGAGTQGYNEVTTSSDPVNLFWSDPLGASSNDYDLFLLDSSGTTVIDASTNVQSGTQDPYEIVRNAITNNRIVVVKRTGAANRFLHLDISRGTLGFATPGSTRGHAAAPHSNAFGVAATPVLTPFGSTANGPFPGAFGPSNEVENFSSDGPRQFFYNADSSPITPGNVLAGGGQTMNKPDITAADGTSTAAPGFDPFYGTSAAAPHAGAIAALVKSANNALTAAQIRNLLVTTAIDIHSAGVDRNSGAGILDAFAAVSAAGVQPRAILVLGNYTTTQLSGDGDGNLEPNEIAALTVPLTNTGSANATAVSATLSTATAGVVMITDTVLYPNIATTSTQTGNPFAFALAPSADCGLSINFTLTVQYTSNATVYTQTFAIVVPTGVPGITPQVAAYTGPAVAILDNNPTGITIPITVSNITGRISDVNFRIDGSSCTVNTGSTTVGVDHSYVGDLVFRLTSPDGRSVTLINRMGQTTNQGHNFCQTTLDDEGGTTPINSASVISAPFTGTFKPFSPLSDLIGGVANGVWTLHVQDLAQPDSGHVRAFSLIIRTFDACDVLPDTPDSIVVSGGNAQTAAVGSAFPTQLQATVFNTASAPIVGVAVTFTAPNTGASVTFPNGNVANTDINGRASVAVVANQLLGTYTVTANVTPPLTSSAVFALTNTVGAPAAILVVSGSGQVSAPNAPFGNPLLAQVTDDFGNNVSGITVTFTAPSSGAGVRFANGGTSISAVTDLSGMASSGAMTATGSFGSYVVTANITPTLASSAQFALSNGGVVYLPLLTK